LPSDITYRIMEIVFATNNEHKLKEINHLLGTSFRILSLIDLNINEDIPENEPTLEGNAIHKARYVFDKTGRDSFADDTGLEIDSLGGMPGVHSARFAGEQKNSEANIKKVLTLLGNSSDRKARFRTVIAFIMEGKQFLFEGIVDGRIIAEKRGTKGFGYDPVFIPDGYDRTFAEMSLAEKNLLSHRAKAFNKLREFLASLEKQNNKEAC
jgi:XTP/dITP diphosphohydrolase